MRQINKDPFPATLGEINLHRRVNLPKMVLNKQQQQLVYLYTSNTTGFDFVTKINKLEK